MSSIRLATASNVRAFQALSHALITSDTGWAEAIDREGLEDEIGRFRVWSGNLGALQKGHSSLDYRLRDSPLLSSNALKFLGELESNINEALAVVSGARLPYELQPKPDRSEEEDEEDDGFFDDDDEEDEDEDGGSQTELSMRFAEIVDIIDNLYKLSVRIRTPTMRSRSLKAATYKPKDRETGVDLLSTYAAYDLQHIKELLEHLRQPHQYNADNNHDDYLMNRLSAAITLRRRQFKYWKRHRDKLGMETAMEEQTDLKTPMPNRPEPPQRNDTTEAQPETPTIMASKDAPSHKTGKTLLSGTEATQHYQSLDEVVDTKSVTSYAVTVKDLHGKGVELPAPPRAADGERDFECPYCYIICPARYGRGRAWRTHLLQDLQPYICTLPNCDSSEQLFRSRREWTEHEASHRKAWRCPEHPGAIYKSSSGLEDHLQREHADSFPTSQLRAIVKVGETTTIDLRSTCPICCVPASTEGLGDFHNHIANHLERIATFALPSGLGEDEDGASSVASRGRSDSGSSRDMSDLSLPSDTTTESIKGPPSDSQFNAKFNDGAIGHEDLDISSNDSKQQSPFALLSAESLSQLPDATQNRVDTLLPNHEAESGGDPEPVEFLHSIPASYDREEDGFPQVPILSLSDIPTLRSMYRLRQLLSRDSSLQPNDSYNQVISFCYHDLTHLRLDAIVNSANRAVQLTSGDTLNNAVHRAAGPAMAKEAKSKGRPKPNQAILTGGFNLPSKHVIHTLRPRGMGESDQLAGSYRSALDLAIENRFRTVAFPCIGTGGVGIPPRVAARIALETIRTYLDAHPGHTFERLVFCVNTTIDEKAYIDFLPTYFPPTHEDLDEARSSGTEDRIALSTRLLDARNQIHKVFSELNTGLSLSVPNFPQNVLSELSAIDSGLASIRRFLLWSQEVTHCLSDLKLVCSVMLLLCGGITEIIDLAKDHANLGQRSDHTIWEDYTANIRLRHGIDLPELLKACHYFTESLETLILREGIEVDQMAAVRQTLELYKVNQRSGPGVEGAQDHLNEVLYTREFQRETTVSNQVTVKLDQVPSIAQLYKLGELEEKPTLSHPSAMFNHTVCFTREDITKLEVDIIVNSTDMVFGGMGALSRTVLAKGGIELQDAVQALGTCAIGDVRATDGYLLPARHVLHVVPPKILDKDTKDILRKIYRKVLRLAISMRATSIAFPSIGTGMLNYPRHDCASIAMEEVRRFLEIAEPANLLEKVIYVVYSSDDEFMYRSLLPVHFPPIDLHVGRAIHSLQSTTTAGTSSSNEPSDAPRTLLGSVGEAYRSVRFGKLPATSRPISPTEEHALIAYESHAKDCVICQDVETLYEAGHDLCADGYSRAQLVLWHMNMQFDHTIWSKPDRNGQIFKIDAPHEQFPLTIDLLATIEKSHRDTARDRPFVSPNQPYEDFAKDKRSGQIASPSPADDSGDMLVPIKKKTRANILTWSKSEKQWERLFPIESDVQVNTPGIDIVDPSTNERLFTLRITSQTALQRHKTIPDVMLAGIEYPGSYQGSRGNVVFRCRSDAECDSLLRAIRHAIIDIQKTRTGGEHQSVPASPADDDGDLQITAERAQRRTRAHVLAWRDSESRWRLITTDECEIRVDAATVVALEPDTVYCLLRLLLANITSVQRHKTTPEITLTVVGERNSQSPDGDYMFRCRSDADCSFLLRMIRRAMEDVQAMQASEGQATTGLPQTYPSLDAAGNYLKWNQRLNDIRDELATVKRTSGGLTDLQFKMERLSQASSSLHSTSRELEAVSELYNASRSPLATRILVCLVADLKSRPGSYIGLDTDSIASTLRAPREEVSSALKELVIEGQIHFTVDENTWVVSHPPKDLPVLSEAQRGASQAPTEAPTSHSTPASRITLSSLALEILSTYLVDAFDNDVAVRLAVAKKMQKNYSEIDRAMEEIKGKVQWYDASGTVLGPQLEPGYLVSGILNGSDPWSCIHRDIVDPRVLRGTGVDFEDRDTFVVLRRFLQRGELLQWATRTSEIRQLQGPHTVVLNSSIEPQHKKDTDKAADSGFAATERPLRTSLTAKKVLTFLVDNPNSIPHGAHYDRDIAAAVEKPVTEVRRALGELKKIGRADIVPVDDSLGVNIINWWAATTTAGGLGDDNQPVDNDPQQDEDELTLADRAMSYLERHTTPIEFEASESTDAETPTPTALAGLVLAYLVGKNHVTRIHHIMDIATTVVKPKVEVEQALAELQAMGKVHRVDDSNDTGNLWAVSIEPDVLFATQHQRLHGARDNIYDANPARSPSDGASIDEEPKGGKHTTKPPFLSLEDIDVNDFFTYDTLNGGPRTRIDKRLVDATVLIERGEHFGDTGDHLVVQRQPGKDEILLWARESVALRRYQLPQQQIDIKGTQTQNKGKNVGTGMQWPEPESQELSEGSPLRPTAAPPSSINTSAPLDLDTVDIGYHFGSIISDDGECTWTWIDKHIVEPAILDSRNEDYDDKGDHYVLHSDLYMEEVRDIAEATVTFRKSSADRSKETARDQRSAEMREMNAEVAGEESRETQSRSVIESSMMERGRQATWDDLANEDMFPRRG